MHVGALKGGTRSDLISFLKDLTLVTVMVGKAVFHAERTDQGHHYKLAMQCIA